MAVKPQTMVAISLIGGAGLLGYAAWRSRQEAAQLRCGAISNSRGGTVSDPCPSSIPVIGGCSQEDYQSWRNRLALQVDSLGTLKRNLDDVGLLSNQMLDRIDEYVAQANALISQFGPFWTTSEDITPFTTTIQVGCALLNEGNELLANRGYDHLVVREPPVVQEWAKAAQMQRRAKIFPWVVGGVAAIAAYWGFRRIWG